MAVDHLFKRWKLRMAALTIPFLMCFMYVFLFHLSWSPAVKTCSDVLSPKDQDALVPKEIWSSTQLSNAPVDMKYIKENWNCLTQEDPQLIEYTRKYHLTPPSKLDYKTPKGNYKGVLNSWVIDFFKNKRNGTFIEVGANDGVYQAHTVPLEMELGWKGLLVECNPTLVPRLRAIQRKAWIADVCLSISPNPAILKFANPKTAGWSPIGRIGSLRHRSAFGGTHATASELVDVIALPFYTILAALGLKEIDYFNFNVEGKELEVFRNFPFHSVVFKVLILGTWYYTDAERHELNDLVILNGYVFVKHFGVDRIYVHNSVKHMLP